MTRTGGKFTEAVVREVSRRAGLKAKTVKEALLVDGFLPGDTPMSEDDERLYLSRLTASLPEMAQRDKGRYDKTMKRIQTLSDQEL